MSRGAGLVFLFSQPRSGSTLLQRMLGAHSRIHATSEPWLMLPLALPLRDEGIFGQYDAYTGRRALRAFLASLPAGEDAYFDAMAEAAEKLYAASASAAGKPLFLDKTPRYYLIFPELRRMFPAARFLVLLRHPLAALASMREAWAGDSLFKLRNHDIDVAWAPARLLEAIAALGPQACVVRYETLVAEPEAELRRVCAHLGVGFEPAIVEYRGAELEPFPIGDRKLYAHPRPHAGSLALWRDGLREPQAWRLASDYLDLLGQETLERLGYSWDEARSALAASRPSRLRLIGTLPLASLLALPIGRGRPLEYALLSLSQTLVRQGIRGTLHLIADRVRARMRGFRARAAP